MTRRRVDAGVTSASSEASLADDDTDQPVDKPRESQAEADKRMLSRSRREYNAHERREGRDPPFPDEPDEEDPE